MQPYVYMHAGRGLIKKKSMEKEIKGLSKEEEYTQRDR